MQDLYNRNRTEHIFIDIKLTGHAQVAQEHKLEWKLLALQITQSRHPISVADEKKMSKFHMLRR